MPTPKTNFSQWESIAQLQPYIGISMGVYDGTQTFSNAQILSIPLTPVGSCTEFKYTNTIVGAGFYRTFNTVSPGTINETYGGLPTYSLSLTTVILYRNTLLEILNFGRADLGYINAPLIIKIDQT